MDDGGVLSTDFLLATLISLIIISALVGFANTSIDTAKSTEFSKAKMVGETVARSINMVYTQGPGDELNITLPGDFNYNITIKNINGKAAVVVNYNNRESISYLIFNTNKINEIPMLPNKTYNIRNEDNSIIIVEVK
ncbi:MAG TPA: hypothetical protein GXX31_01785 [Methanothermobacter sp.]|uniref:Flagellar protein G n=1 Tax=Methanothermobacter tenebrarum TaxID=680118 RepID=A0ABM7YDS7_9EURY|nr:hypothetical protein [Methanothermobacter tenebrarum]MDI6881655.1 hypothetical protein [Methanothermobacter sp.]BDH79373.1 hypothetical protein MTTB_07520 [Methanothermobacter tenebrarum]HHW16105.1 hypothetical protein [Methanothermobacter sp.]